MIEKVIVLSLNDATQRRAPLIASLKRLNIDFTLWPAVDGRAGLSDADAQRIDRARAQGRMGRAMSDAEFACALSHRDIYSAILRHGWAHTLILEDDAILTPGFGAFVQNVAQDDYDLLLLDHWRTRVHTRDDRPINPAHRAIRVAGSPMLTTGYVVSLEGARALAAASTPVTATADWPCDLSELRAYAVTPRLVDHPDMATGTSDIRPQRQALKETPPRWKRRHPKRFLDPEYWKRAYYKRFWKWIS